MSTGGYMNTNIAVYKKIIASFCYKTFLKEHIKAFP